MKAEPRGSAFNKRMTQWRSGLTLRFAKPPFAGSTPACVSSWCYTLIHMKKYFPHVLLGAYILEFLVLAINPIDRPTWWVENLTILPIVAVLVVLYIKKIRFSNTAYALMSVLIFMHTFGGHYTFALTPFDWFNNFFGFERNMYDRVAHASVGLYSYAIIEILLKYKVVTKRWFAYFSAVVMIIALAGLYEIFEWWFAISADPEAGIAVLGAQGDIWDAQKDMLMDTMGGLVGAVTYFFCNRSSK